THVVDVHQLPHLVVADVVDRTGHAEAGVAHHHVETPEAFDGRRDEAVHVIRARHVRGHGQYLTARRDDVGGRGVERRFPPRTDGDLRAVTRQAYGRCSPDTRRRAGDGDDTHKNSLQVAVAVSS